MTAPSYQWCCEGVELLHLVDVNQWPAPAGGLPALCQHVSVSWYPGVTVQLGPNEERKSLCWECLSAFVAGGIAQKAATQPPRQPRLSAETRRMIARRNPPMEAEMMRQRVEDAAIIPDVL